LVIWSQPNWKFCLQYSNLAPCKISIFLEQRKAFILNLQIWAKLEIRRDICNRPGPTSQQPKTVLTTCHSHPTPPTTDLVSTRWPRSRQRARWRWSPLVVAAAPLHGVLIPRCMRLVETPSPFRFLTHATPHSYAAWLCFLPVCPVHRWATDPPASSCAASIVATLARRATIRKRSHRRRPRAEASTIARSAAKHPATASLPQPRFDSNKCATRTTPPRSSLPTPSWSTWVCLFHSSRRICVPNVKELKGKILHEAHESAYSIHLGAFVCLTSRS
jgi:hypothetical protein